MNVWRFGLIAMIASAGCASASGPIASPTSDPHIASTTPVTSFQRGCLESVHQPFPPDEPGHAVDQEAEALVKVPPSYPDEARERGVDGLVRIRALVCEHGRVVNTVVSTSIPLLDSAAQDAVMQWQFRPAQREGRPVATWVDVPVKFSMH